MDRESLINAWLQEERQPSIAREKLRVTCTYSAKLIPLRTSA